VEEQYALLVPRREWGGGRDQKGRKRGKIHPKIAGTVATDREGGKRGESGRREELAP